SFDRVHPERLADFDQRPLGCRDIEFYLAAEKAIGTQSPKNQIGVCYGWFLTTLTVAGRTRLRTRALRTYPQQSIIGPSDRTATRANLENVHHGDLYRQGFSVATDQRRARGQGLSLVNNSGFCGGAAHVKCDSVFDAQPAAKRLRADHAGRRTTLKHPNTLGLRLFTFIKATGRLHDEKRAVEAGFADVIVDLADVAAHFRPDISVGGNGRTALKLAIFL